MKTAPSQSKPTVGIWGRTFRRYLAKGHDHGSAAYAADQAEERAARKARKSKERGEARD